MKLPSTLLNSLRCNLFSIYCNSSKNFKINTISNILGYTSITKEDMFIPVAAVNTLMNVINNTQDKYIYSWLFAGIRTGLECKTSNYLVANLIDSSCIKAVRSKSDELYYGCKGLILNKNFKPMLMSGYKGEYINNKLKLIEPVCYIDTTVFNNTDLVSTCIIKKIIPYMCDSNLCTTIDIVHTLPTIIVKDISKLIYKVPQITHNVDTLSNELWSRLNDY